MNILDRPSEMMHISYATVMKTLLPNRYSTTHTLLNFLCGVAFEVPHDVRNCDARCCDNQMKVIGHQGIGVEKKVPAITVEPEIVHDYPAKPRITKDRLAIKGVSCHEVAEASVQWPTVVWHV
jgi:hypothetical protein